MSPDRFTKTEIKKTLVFCFSLFLQLRTSLITQFLYYDEYEVVFIIIIDIYRCVDYLYIIVRTI